MAENAVHPACTICGIRRKKHKTILGAVICKSCLGELEMLRLKPLEKFGRIDYESGSNFIHPFWIKAHGELLDPGKYPQQANFSKKGLVSQAGSGDEQPLQSGVRDFDRRVKILSGTPDATLQFLSDPVVRQVLEFMVGNGGKLTMDGNQIELEMNGQFLQSTSQAYPIRDKGQWAFGILFAKLGEFYSE